MITHYLLCSPGVEVDALHFRNVDPQIPVDTSTADA